jgi:hypothetical protein
VPGESLAQGEADCLQLALAGEKQCRFRAIATQNYFIDYAGQFIYTQNMKMRYRVF